MAKEKKKEYRELSTRMSSCKLKLMITYAADMETFANHSNALNAVRSRKAYLVIEFTALIITVIVD